MSNHFKIGAIACCAVYLLTYLLLPVLSLLGLANFNTFVPTAGKDLLGISVWSFLPLISAVAMGVCAVALPGKKAALVSIIGAFIPILAFFLIRNDAVGALGGMTGGTAIISSLAGYVLKVGIGTILPIFCGVGSAVLCYLSDNVSKPAERTAGLGADSGDEW